MKQIEKIDYMIKSLEVAKDEITYAELYKQKKIEQGDEFYGYSGFGCNHRCPIGATVKEALRMVGRKANQVEKTVSLSSYCDEPFEGEENR